MPPVYVIGDVHGHCEEVIAALEQAGLVSASQHWCGGGATLWFTGDFCDRGPDGVAAIDLAMRLQREASAVGGKVDAVLGNHDILLLAVKRFESTLVSDLRGSFRDNWQRNGGVASDLESLTDAHIAWMNTRPALCRVEDRLLMHADTPAYAVLGRSIDAVNHRVSEIMCGRNLADWLLLLETLSNRGGFLDLNGDTHPLAIAETLDRFGGGTIIQLVHGHTPIHYVTGDKPGDTCTPLVYGSGRCVNVDGGIYLGGPVLMHHFDNGFAPDLP